MNPITQGRWILSGSIFIIGPLYLIGMWFDEEQRANIVKTHVQSDRLCLQILVITLHSIIEHN